MSLPKKHVIIEEASTLAATSTILTIWPTDSVASQDGPHIIAQGSRHPYEEWGVYEAGAGYHRIVPLIYQLGHFDGRLKGLAKVVVVARDRSYSLMSRGHHYNWYRLKKHALLVLYETHLYSYQLVFLRLWHVVDFGKFTLINCWKNALVLLMKYQVSCLRVNSVVRQILILSDL